MALSSAGHGKQNGPKFEKKLSAGQSAKVAPGIELEEGGWSR